MPIELTKLLIECAKFIGGHLAEFADEKDEYNRIEHGDTCKNQHNWTRIFRVSLQQKTKKEEKGSIEKFPFYA